MTPGDIIGAMLLGLGLMANDGDETSDMSSELAILRGVPGLLCTIPSADSVLWAGEYGSAAVIVWISDPALSAAELRAELLQVFGVTEDGIETELPEDP